jgi:5-methylcytosine-specific restriction endonuclease McrA
MIKPAKTRCNGQWTEARFASFIKSALRSASNRWAPKFECKKAARIGRNQYVCALCRAVVGNRGIKIDHINPVVGPEGFQGWDRYIERMFVEGDGFQAVCEKCHDKKTKREAEFRKQNRVQQKLKWNTE